MKRRVFNKIIVAGFAASINKVWASPFTKKAEVNLPEVTMNGKSVEICINSRYSVHSGYSKDGDNKIIANTLWAASQAPLLAAERTIYAALSDNLYTYRFGEEGHLFEVHASGDKRTESNTAFEIGIATDPENVSEDAGAALHWAHLASVAFWENTTNRPVCCPKDSSRDAANNVWNASSNIHLVNCYGTMASVAGLKNPSSPPVSSSNSSLSNPVTDGAMSIEDAMKNPLFGSDFSSASVTSEQLSQLLWASYGCTSHKTINNFAALSVASWKVKNFLTGKIYIVDSSGVRRYHNRVTDANFDTVDHRIETVSTDDCRSALRSAISRLPQNAPVYIVYCGSAASSEDERPQRIEAGACGAGALLQATALGLQGHYVAHYTNTERSAIQTACGIPTSNLPMLIFSVGKAAGTGNQRPASTGVRLGLQVGAAPNPFTYTTVIHYNGNVREGDGIRIFNSQGALVKTLRPSGMKRNGVLWDGTDTFGRTVRPGTYIARIIADGKTASATLKKR